MNYLILITAIFLIIAGDIIVKRTVKQFHKNKKVMGKYVAKRNDDGTIALFQVGDSIGVDFAVIQTLVQVDGETALDALNANVNDLQNQLDDVNARITAVSALPIVETPVQDAATVAVDQSANS